MTDKMQEAIVSKLARLKITGLSKAITALEQAEKDKERIAELEDVLTPFAEALCENDDKFYSPYGAHEIREAPEAMQISFTYLIKARQALRTDK